MSYWTAVKMVGLFISSGIETVWAIGVAIISGQPPQYQCAEVTNLRPFSQKHQPHFVNV